MKSIRAGLGDHADLTASAGAVFSRVGTRLDAEFLHVLETGLEFEGRVVLAVHIAGRGVDDRGALDAVVSHRVLFVRAAAETDVLPRARAGVLRARRLQQKL